MAIRLLLADDYEFILEALQAILCREADVSVLGVALDGRTALELTGTLAPDILVLDVSMPDMDGVEVTRVVKARHPKVKVIAFSGHSDAEIARRVLAAGASGFVAKASASDEIVPAIRDVAAGKVFLSPQVANELLAR